MPLTLITTALLAAGSGRKVSPRSSSGLLLFEREVPHADRLFRLCALVIVGSIVAHSPSDTLLARWFVDKDGRPTVEPEEEPAA